MMLIVRRSADDESRRFRTFNRKNDELMRHTIQLPPDALARINMLFDTDADEPNLDDCEDSLSPCSQPGVGDR